MIQLVVVDIFLRDDADGVVGGGYIRNDPSLLLGRCARKATCLDK